MAGYVGAKQYRCARVSDVFSTATKQSQPVQNAYCAGSCPGLACILMCQWLVEPRHSWFVVIVLVTVCESVSTLNALADVSVK